MKEVEHLAKECAICKKGAVSGNQISHSTRHSKRVWNPNLKKVKATIGNTEKRIMVCTRCLRSGKVERAI